MLNQTLFSPFLWLFSIVPPQCAKMHHIVCCFIYVSEVKCGLEISRVTIV